MALTDGTRLYDIATRQALYIEGIKARESQEFNYVMADLRIELRHIMSRVKFKNLDELTKVELNRLILTLRAAQARVYSAYTVKLIQQLQDFMQVDLEVTRRVFAVGFIEDDAKTERRKVVSEAEAIEIIKEQQGVSGIVPLFGILAATTDDGRVWSSIINAPMPANGLFILPFINGFQASAIAGVENIMRKSYANRLTLADTVDLIAAEPTPQGTSSQLERVKTQASAVIGTTFGHVAAIAAAAVGSALFAKYRWVSVMDNRTTEICIHRNGKTYRYGKGPLPPAHTKCRSHTTPMNNVGTAVAAAIAAESLYDWVYRQPEEVQDDFLGEELSEEVRNGSKRQKDLPKSFAVTPITIDEYATKVPLILSTGE